MICDNLQVNSMGKLMFAKHSVCELAKKFGTPLYIMDEEKIRENLRRIKGALVNAFGEGAEVLYASKACDFKRIYGIVKEENCGVDVVSAGEIFTAYSAGFPMDKVYFHGNNKTDKEIRFAMDKGVGCFVVDSVEELNAVDKIAEEKGIVQKILFRITPGIDPHTYAAVATGLVDSKFGNAIETKAASRIVALALSKKHIHLAGFHCHVGSQVFDSEVFLKSAKIMLEFIREIQETLSVTIEELNLGGGYGVRYVESDPVIDIEKCIMETADYIKTKCQECNIQVPAIRMEPGRSIVADAGCTVYTVGSVKNIPGYRTYVSVDGGMTDNPRYALYHSAYTVVCANKMNEEKLLKCTVAGKCCESGDILQENVMLPTTIKRDDFLAVLTTGAYNYSMASNYNRIPRPAVIMIDKEKAYVAVKRESFEDLIKNEL